MREIRLSGSEGGGFEYNRFPLPLSTREPHFFTASPARAPSRPGWPCYDAWRGQRRGASGVRVLGVRLRLFFANGIYGAGSRPLMGAMSRLRRRVVSDRQFFVTCRI